MRYFTSKDNYKGFWVFPTLFVLMVIFMSYIFYLFPRDSSAAMQAYQPNLTIPLVLVFMTLAINSVFRKFKTHEIKQKQIYQEKKIKTIERLIWRNRYVLQAVKAKINKEEGMTNSPRWQNEKINFAEKKIFSVISKADVSFEQISMLIEKSLKGASIGGIMPPVYGVKDIKKV